MSYTKGPWRLQESPSGGAILIRPPLDGQKYAMQSHVQIVPLEDARLIAAAPDLLQACQMVLAEFGYSFPNTHRQQIEAAILKATEAK